MVIFSFSVVSVEFDPDFYEVDEDTPDGFVELVIVKTGTNEIDVTVDIETTPGLALGQ